MTKEEFIKKFKVGDLICRPYWSKEDKTKIVFIGRDKFVVDDYSLGNKSPEDGEEYWDYSSYKDWEHYKEPVKKDLEGFVYCFRVFKDTQNVIYRLEPVIVYKDYYDKADKELLITKEEAIERGLKF